ncbi:MAG: NADH-quinone oxidoreductase subunit J [Planctomycetes bacterium]|nr:NADH-quinone oxidoreductase subunit J [Planctomycetota bacterium]
MSVIEAIVFYIFAGLLVFSSVFILFGRNIIRSAMWLMAALGAVAALLLLLGANYLAAVQLVLYIGGVLVLIVFGVMLTAKSPYIRYDVKLHEQIAGFVVGGLLLAGLLVALLNSPWPKPPGVVSDQAASVRDFGERLLTSYWLPFELVSLLLLAVMVGAAVLARPEKR